MQGRSVDPPYGGAGPAGGIVSHPEIGNSDEVVGRINQRQAIPHPRDDALFLKQILESLRM